MCDNNKFMICEKCGFDYEGEKCPVCEAEVPVVETVETFEIPEKKSKLFGILGLVAGVASIVLAFIGGSIIGPLLGLLGGILLILPAAIPGAAAIVLGVLGLKNSKGLGIAAIILGALSIIVFLVTCMVTGAIANLLISLISAIFGISMELN